MNKEEKDFILYAWNDETKEFWFLGEKIDYIHNPKEWKKYLNDLVSENKLLKQKVNQLETNRDEAIKELFILKDMIYKPETREENFEIQRKISSILIELERGKE